ncbi:MAG: fumarylacetoacetate hydrolase family protein [Lachnospiraceae bacterium]|jgi:2-keto-4-pentenoate hydratase/2-oxohepta-3-ene-1,7-dioic acid hydratase in catechol pathway|nr:fumarylacetoacetate hydrolase family protein [Lachnospiraceae bacterium]
MKLVTYQAGQRTGVGVISADGEWVFPIQSIGPEYTTMMEVIKQMSDSEKQLLDYASRQEPYSYRGAARLQEVRLLAPIPAPEQDIICLGINYMDHAEESARFRKREFDGKRPYAVYFSKRVNKATADGENIPSHENLVDSLDYEAELAFIIRKDARNVTVDQVKDYIFGYTILNDVSARNIQNRHNQWYFGKSLDGFSPMGPCILTADSIAYPPCLEIRSYVNGELRQNSNTSKLIFNIDHIVCELSSGMTLKAGTIISTGTPSGVGMGFDPPKFLKSGDEVICQIEEIGQIRNVIE